MDKACKVLIVRAFLVAGRRRDEKRGVEEESVEEGEGFYEDTGSAALIVCALLGWYFN